MQATATNHPINRFQWFVILVLVGICTIPLGLLCRYSTVEVLHEDYKTPIDTLESVLEIVVNPYSSFWRKIESGEVDIPGIRFVKKFSEATNPNQTLQWPQIEQSN